MKVYKFGGASVNSANAVRNMASIVVNGIDSEPLIVVVSAMGKTTNLLERLVPGVSSVVDVVGLKSQLKEYHYGIARELLPNNETVTLRLDELFVQVDSILTKLSPTTGMYNYNYDQVVSFGELLSTTIIAEYLNSLGISAKWLDARNMLCTDDKYREGNIEWHATESFVNRQVAENNSYSVLLTQGFIGGTTDGNTTTLGREGSDYSAAVIAYCVEAESVTIWKDVPGFLNADPKFFSNTLKIERLPYSDAIELAYYGASVIHPKTVKPIQNKGIPLFIKSFIAPEEKGSIIGNFESIEPHTPLYIFKNNQILLSVSPRDYSFVAEDRLQQIFGVLSSVGAKVNMMQNSALSFSICIDNNPMLLEELKNRLNAMFRVRYNDNLQLITIRYYNQKVVDDTVKSRPVLLEQRSRHTAQLLVPLLGNEE
ncbi:MAG: aspartate kinase [Bacteroidales bacterium]|nr:aspartate kinase [Bacteroidales bacterium]